MNFGSNVNLSKNILDYSNTKNNIITNNLSNISNPEYKRKYMDELTFGTELKEALKTTKKGHLTGIENSNDFMKIKTEYSKGRNDENNVNLDKEVIDLTTNQYLFNINSSILQKEYTKLKESII